MRPVPPFPVTRLRRLRSSSALRDLVRETRLHPSRLVWPIFVHDTIENREPVPSMPGVFRFPPEEAAAQAAEAAAEGIRAVILFGIPALKDEEATGAWDPQGVIQRTVRRIRRSVPDIAVITDVCLCEYMSHGHCGVAASGPRGETKIDNDRTLELLARTACSHAEAGADIVAPSDMMDGRVGAIRSALDAAGYRDTAILSYAVKYASAFYGPFRDAAESPPRFGDRRSYQMDPANAREAEREIELDLREGADMLLVKPGLPSLDILHRVRGLSDVPLGVYCVSGEYAMVKAAAAEGWIDERSAVLEMMTAFLRAGADFIVTYWARDILRWTRPEP